MALLNSEAVFSAAVAEASLFFSVNSEKRRCRFFEVEQRPAQQRICEDN